MCPLDRQTHLCESDYVIWPMHDVGLDVAACSFCSNAKMLDSHLKCNFEAIEECFGGRSEAEAFSRC